MCVCVVYMTVCVCVCLYVQPCRTKSVVSVLCISAIPCLSVEDEQRMIIVTQSSHFVLFILKRIRSFQTRNALLIHYLKKVVHSPTNYTLPPASATVQFRSKVSVSSR